jgi:hypothetical protein
MSAKYTPIKLNNYKPVKMTKDMPYFLLGNVIYPVETSGCIGVDNMIKNMPKI